MDDIRDRISARKAEFDRLRPLARASLTGDKPDFRAMMLERLDATLGDYLDAVGQALP